MKILVVSLLRLGDILLATPAIKLLKQKHKHAKIHLLINDQFKKIEPMLLDVDKVIGFPRESLQASIANPDRALLEPFDRLENFLEEMNQEGYDLVLNFTHNKLSGWICQSIEADKKLGLVLAPDGTPHFGSEWFAFLNSQGARQKENCFHYSDIFIYGSGLRATDRKVHIRETENGISNADIETRGLKPYIAIQASTSDVKKEWGAKNFLRALSLLSQVEGRFSHVILCGPGEKEKLTELVAGLHEQKIRHKLIECDFETAFSILNNAELLLTGDTSIKHLAAATQVPILELGMGSSSFERTGAYTDRALIVQPLEKCFPCDHSSTCPYVSHRCGEKVSPELVSLLMQSLLTKNWSDIKTIAREYQDEVRILRTEFSTTGEWKAFPVVEQFTLEEITRWLDRTGQRLFLNESHSEMLNYGTEGINLSRLFHSIFPEKEKIEWLETYKKLETKYSSLESELTKLMSELKLVIKYFDSEIEFERFQRRLIDLVEQYKNSRLFSSYMLVLDDVLSDFSKSGTRFTLIKKLREILTALHKRAEIELRLIKSLQSQILENV